MKRARLEEIRPIVEQLQVNYPQAILSAKDLGLLVKELFLDVERHLLEEEEEHEAIRAALAGFVDDG